ARKLFQSIATELEEVSVEGWHAFALKSTLKPMEELGAVKTVRLLPLFDGYTFAVRRDVESLLPQAYKLQVFRPQGWISATVLADGIIKGVWDYKTRGAQTTLKIKMFSPLTASIRRGIEAEAERLGAFFNTNVELTYEVP
ncbi:MAG TPA: crosslink repair DNA glycosylase YcaQ family protein, partial [Anaerolineales bacterium]|nr:crosslink repair DNA glycosylase YcaQ family protein [Anaerolineales bacterium]